MKKVFAIVLAVMMVLSVMVSLPAGAVVVPDALPTIPAPNNVAVQLLEVQTDESNMQWLVYEVSWDEEEGIDEFELYNWLKDAVTGTKYDIPGRSAFTIGKNPNWPKEYIVKTEDGRCKITCQTPILGENETKFEHFEETNADVCTGIEAGDTLIVELQSSAQDPETGDWLVSDFSAPVEVEFTEENVLNNTIFYSEIPVYEVSEPDTTEGTTAETTVEPTTEEPTTEATEPTTAEPTTEATEPTTTAPEPTTEATEATTEAPKPTTEPVTDAPEVTTAPATEVPVVTTAPATDAPVVTTAPETYVPQPTTEPPQPITELVQPTTSAEVVVNPTEAPTMPATGIAVPTQPVTAGPVQPTTSAEVVVNPTEAPTMPATEAPTQAPTEAPAQAPTEAPTQPATEAPTEAAEFTAKLKRTTIRIDETTAVKVEGGSGKVKFSSKNSKIAKVDKDGNVKGVSAGKTDIIVKTGENKKTLKITVKKKTNDFSASGVTLKIKRNKEAQFNLKKKLKVKNAKGSVSFTLTGRKKYKCSVSKKGTLKIPKGNTNKFLLHVSVSDKGNKTYVPKKITVTVVVNVKK